MSIRVRRLALLLVFLGPRFVPMESVLEQNPLSQCSIGQQVSLSPVHSRFHGLVILLALFLTVPVSAYDDIPASENPGGCSWQPKLAKNSHY
jgi:hypothetical protein